MSKWFQAWEDEAIIRYTIDVPKPAGDGTALETPSIKVIGLPEVVATLLIIYRRMVRRQYSAMLQPQANFLDS